MNDTSMSKRIGLTLADAIHDKLERWAKSEGRPIASVSIFPGKGLSPSPSKERNQARLEGKIPIAQAEQHKTKEP